MHNWTSSFKLRVLEITQQFPKGVNAKILCTGRGCPFKTKRLKLGKIKHNAADVLKSLGTKQRRFHVNDTVEVWVSAPGFNTKVARIALKKGKQPVIQPLCALPGASRAQKTCG